MSNQDHEDYFEDLAKRFRPIGHTEDAPRFCRFDMEEVVSGLVHQLDLTNYCLLLEAPSGELEDNGSDGFFDNQEVAFMIIREVPDRDFPAQKLALSEARQLGVQLLAKVVQERRFTDLDENTVEYVKVGPVFGNCYGYRYSFGVVDEISMAINAADWDE